MLKKWTCFFILFFYTANLFAYSDHHQTYPMDYQISENITMLFALNPTIKELNLEVTTNNGIVTLVGVTHTDYKAGKAIEIASCTPGVRDVDTAQLTIDYGRPVTRQTVLWNKYHGKLLQERLYPCECLS